jgi:hypothetical protein
VISCVIGDTTLLVVTSNDVTATNSMQSRLVSLEGVNHVIRFTYVKCDGCVVIIFDVTVCDVMILNIIV